MLCYFDGVKEEQEIGNPTILVLSTHARTHLPVGRVGEEDKEGRKDHHPHQVVCAKYDACGISISPVSRHLADFTLPISSSSSSNCHWQWSCSSFLLGRPGRGWCCFLCVKGASGGETSGSNDKLRAWQHVDGRGVCPRWRSFSFRLGSSAMMHTTHMRTRACCRGFSPP